MSVRINSFSKGNRYANDYYIACKEFENIQNGIKNLKYKNDVNPVESQKLTEDLNI